MTSIKKQLIVIALFISVGNVFSQKIQYFTDNGGTEITSFNCNEHGQDLSVKLPLPSGIKNNDLVAVRMFYGEYEPNELQDCRFVCSGGQFKAMKDSDGMVTLKVLDPDNAGNVYRGDFRFVNYEEICLGTDPDEKIGLRFVIEVQSVVGEEEKYDDVSKSIKKFPIYGNPIRLFSSSTDLPITIKDGAKKRQKKQRIKTIAMYGGIGVALIVGTILYKKNH